MRFIPTMKNINPEIAKGFLHLLFWLSVGLAVVVVNLASNFLGFSDLECGALVYVAEYFDARLVVGIVCGSLAYVFIASIVFKGRTKYEVFAEITDQSLNIISVILAANFYIVLARWMNVLGKCDNDKIQFVESLIYIGIISFGLCCWLLYVIERRSQLK